MEWIFKNKFDVAIDQASRGYRANLKGRIAHSEHEEQGREELKANYADMQPLLETYD